MEEELKSESKFKKKYMQILVIVAIAILLVGVLLKIFISKKSVKTEKSTSLEFYTNYTNMSPIQRANAVFIRCKEAHNSSFYAIIKRDKSLCMSTRNSCPEFVEISIALDKDDSALCENLDGSHQHLCYAILQEEPKYCEKLRYSHMDPSFNKSLVIEQCKLMSKTIKKAYQNKDEEICNKFVYQKGGLYHIKDWCFALLGKLKISKSEMCEREYLYDVAVAEKNISLCEDINDDYYKLLCKIVIEKDLAHKCVLQNNIPECFTCHNFTCVAIHLNDSSFCDYEFESVRDSCKNFFKD